MNKQTEKKLLDIVRKKYNEEAEHFSETRKKHLWPELLNLAKQVKRGDYVLDAGCGNGRLLQAFQDKQVNYIGVDSSEKLIELARKNHPGEDFRVENILNLGKIPEINFDFVFCIAVLHHLPGKRMQVDTLRQLKNKIKKDGKIIITVWNLWKRKEFKKIIWKYFALKLIKKNKMDFGDILFEWKDRKGTKRSQRYYHAFTKRELKRIAKKAGLKKEKIYQDKHNYYAVLKRK